MLHHQVVEYHIRYKDGTRKSGIMPYQTNDLPKSHLELWKQFAKHYFGGDPATIDFITAECLQEFNEDQETWIKQVYQTDGFQHLHRMHGYADPILREYNLRDKLPYLQVK